MQCHNESCLGWCSDFMAEWKDYIVNSVYYIDNKSCGTCTEALRHWGPYLYKCVYQLDITVKFNGSEFAWKATFRHVHGGRDKLFCFVFFSKSQDLGWITISCTIGVYISFENLVAHDSKSRTGDMLGYHGPMLGSYSESLRQHSRKM